MSTYYVDPGAGGGDTGADWTNAWVSIQSAFDTAGAGDVVYCRGTQTLSAQIDIDTNSGNDTTGWIKFIGCNGSGDVDGTRFTINGNGGAFHGIDMGAQNFLWFENIRVTNCGNSTSYNGFNATTGGINPSIFINCSFDTNAGDGMDAGQSNYLSLIFRCTFYANGQYGITTPSCKVLFSSFHDNTSHGVYYPSTASVFVGNLIYDNGGDGVTLVDDCTTMIQNVINGNDVNGITLRAASSTMTSVLIANRITNHAGVGDIGLDCQGKIVVHGYNYFENNDGNNIQNNSLAQFIPAEGGTATTDVEDQSDTNQGYTTLTDGSEDFNLRSDATLRRTAISVPLV